MKRGFIYWSVVLIGIILLGPANAQEKGSKPQKNCKIKGLVGHRGTKMYLLPDNPLYDRLDLRESQGERWFCSEAQAEDAGFILLVSTLENSRKPPVESFPPEQKPSQKPPKGEWRVDISNVDFPLQSVSGTFKGTPFVAEQTWLEDGILKLRQGKGFIPDMEFQVPLSLNSGETVKNKTYYISANSSGSDNPSIYMQWKEGENDELVSKEFRSGEYALRLEFGTIEERLVRGKIYLCVNDELQSHIVGYFRAEIFDRPKP